MATEEVIKFLESVMKDLPERCMPLLGADVNDGLRKGGEELTGGEAVGPYSQAESVNGPRYRAMLEVMGMTAINSWVNTGYTYFGFDGTISIDVAMMQRGAHKVTHRYRSAKRLRLRVQLVEARGLLDHVPIFVGIEYDFDLFFGGRAGLAGATTSWRPHGGTARGERSFWSGWKRGSSDTRTPRKADERGGKAGHNHRRGQGAQLRPGLRRPHGGAKQTIRRSSTGPSGWMWRCGCGTRAATRTPT